MGNNHTVRLVKHDEGINHRSCTYIRVCWLIFLAFPLDFQKDLYIRAAVAPYGRLLEWYRDENKSRILVQCLLLSPDRVPRSLTVSRGTIIGGMGRSWAVPVYILDGHFPDAFPADEDPVPFDGEPHPEHAPVVMGANPQDPNWEHEQQGAAANLGVFGGNPHPNPPLHFNPVHFQHAQNGEADNGLEEAAEENMDVDPEEDEAWQPWDPAVFVADNGANNQGNDNQIPQHPAVPQHLLDLDLSGSSMRFLHANRPDIGIEEVMQLSDNSSSSSDASSSLAEERARFNAARSYCATISLFHRKNCPGGNSLGPSTITMKPIFIDNTLLGG